MQNRTRTLILAALASGAFGTSAVTAQAVPQDETFTLARVAGNPLPALLEEEDGCRDEVVSGTLTLEADGDWILVTQEREICGEKVTEDEEREKGTYSLEGDTIRFLDDDAGDGDDEEEDDGLDIDDLTAGSRTAEGLTVRLEDTDAVLVFRR